MMCPKFRRQPVGRHLHEFRRRGLYNDEDLILRERVPVGLLMLAPWQIFWQELVGIGGDGEMRGRIERRTDRQYRCNDYDRPRIARTEADHPQDRRCQHAVYSLCARGGSRGNTRERAGIFSTPLTAKSLQSLGQSRVDNQNFQATATTA